MSQLPALLRTDLSQMAERVRRAGRGPDTMLAHITPKEAALLRAQGGSGTTNPMTGLPEFFDYEKEQYNPVYQEIPEVPFNTPVVPSMPELNFNRDYPVEAATYGELSPDFTTSPRNMPFLTGGAEGSTPTDLGGFSAPQGIRFSPGSLGEGAFEFPQPDVLDRAYPRLPVGGEQAPDIAAALRARAKSAGEFLQTPLGYGAIGAIPALLQARRASKQAQQLQQELGRLGQEARTQGRELVQQARSGQITATQQQQLEAQRAAALQNLSRRGITGGTAVQQLEQSLQNQRGRFLEDTLNQGLRLINVGDQYTSQAIRAGYQADAQAQQLLGNFFNNYMRVLGGQAQTQPTQTPAPRR